VQLAGVFLVGNQIDQKKRLQQTGFVLRFFTSRGIYKITLPAKIAGVNGYNYTAFAVFDKVQNYSFGCYQHNQFRVSGFEPACRQTGSKFHVSSSKVKLKFQKTKNKIQINHNLQFMKFQTCVSEKFGTLILWFCKLLF
jgi:hypothetical protein